MADRLESNYPNYPYYPAGGVCQSNMDGGAAIAPLPEESVLVYIDYTRLPLATAVHRRHDGACTICPGQMELKIP